MHYCALVLFKIHRVLGNWKVKNLVRVGEAIGIEEITLQITADTPMLRNSLCMLMCV